MARRMMGLSGVVEPRVSEHHWPEPAAILRMVLMLCMRPAYELSQLREIHFLIYTLHGYSRVPDGLRLLRRRGVGCCLGQVPHRAIKVARATSGLCQSEMLNGAGVARGDRARGTHLDVCG